jgi:hypothetical protein
MYVRKAPSSGMAIFGLTKRDVQPAFSVEKPALMEGFIQRLPKNSRSSATHAKGNFNV